MRSEKGLCLGAIGPPACRPWFRIAVLLLVGWLGVAVGCTGRGTVHVMPYLRSDLPEQEPLIQKMPIHEAYYWLDDDEVNVALRYRTRSLFGRAFDVEYAVSLVLPELPAGRERLYRLRSGEIQIIQSAGADHRRGRSSGGVAVLHGTRGDTLRGRFHVITRQQQFSALAGWMPETIHRGAMLIVAGEFNAVHDPDRGRRIRERTEADGFERSNIRSGLVPVPTSPVPVPTRPAEP